MEEEVPSAVEDLEQRPRDPLAEQHRIGQRHDGVVAAVEHEGRRHHRWQLVPHVVGTGSGQLGLEGAGGDRVGRSVANLVVDEGGVRLAEGSRIEHGAGDSVGLFRAARPLAEQRLGGCLFGRYDQVIAARPGGGEHQGTDEPGMSHDELLRDHSPERRAQHNGVFHPKTVEHGRRVIAELCCAEGVRRDVRRADAALIVDGRPEVPNQAGKDGVEHDARRPQAGDEQQRRTVAGDGHGEAKAVAGGDVYVGHRGGCYGTPDGVPAGQSAGRAPIVHKRNPPMRSREVPVDTSRSRVVDITERLEAFVAGGGDGLLNVLALHATAGLALMESGSGSEADLVAALERLLPRDDRYAHRHGSPGHGADHLLPVLVSPALTLPVVAGELVLGTWQRVVLVDLNADNPARRVRLDLLAG